MPIGGDPDPGRGGRCAHARRPDQRAGLDPASRGIGAAGIAACHLDTEADIHAHAAQCRQGVGRQVLGQRREQSRPGLDEHHICLGRIDPSEIVTQRVARDLGNRSGHLDPGRAAPDDDEGQQPDLLVAIRGKLRLLERQQNPLADHGCIGDPLQSGREPRPFLVAEIGVRGAGREHKIVVVKAAFVGLDAARREVDCGDFGHHDAHVGLAPEQVAGRPCNVGRGEGGGRGLIEQRLKGMVVLAVDQGDRGVRAP